MTVKILFEKALMLLGYTDSTGASQTNNRMRSRAFAVVNQVYSDLFYALNPDGVFNEVHKWEDKINLPDRILHEVAPYGVASFLASTEGDGENMQIFTALFNQKRALLTHFEDIKDTIPTAGEE